MSEQATSFNTWAIVEQMGHRRFAGYVTEQAFGIAVMIRVDVPATEQPERKTWQGTVPARTTAEYSKLLGVQSIYGITPCTEEVARKAARVIEADNDPIPVAIPVERRIPAAVGADDAQLDEFTDVDDHQDDDDDDFGR